MSTHTRPAMTLVVARGLTKAELLSLFTRETGRRRSFLQELGALVRRPVALPPRRDFRVA